MRLTAQDCRVLGLDPGSQRTGYGVIDRHGRGEGDMSPVAATSMLHGQDMVLRLQRIYRAMAANW